VSRIILSFSIIFISLFSQAQSKSEILLEEFDRIQNFIEQQEADGVVGGLYPFIQQEGYILMSSQEFGTKHDLIRFFMNREGLQKDFAVTYIRSHYLLEGREVLKRFVGYEPTGWRNDTIDVKTGEDLGFQGVESLLLDEEAQSLLQAWDIQLF
jgi:hypothetical protein